MDSEILSLQIKKRFDNVVYAHGQSIKDYIRTLNDRNTGYNNYYRMVLSRKRREVDTVRKWLLCDIKGTHDFEEHGGIVRTKNGLRRYVDRCKNCGYKIEN